MIPDPRAAAVAYADAKARYLCTHPEPKYEDFPCRRCGAPAGEPCAMKAHGATGFHAPRMDRCIRARMAWGVAVVNAGDAAVNALYSNPAA